MMIIKIVAYHLIFLRKLAIFLWLSNLFNDALSTIQDKKYSCVCKTIYLSSRNDRIRSWLDIRYTDQEVFMIFLSLYGLMPKECFQTGHNFFLNPYVPSVYEYIYKWEIQSNLSYVFSMTQEDAGASLKFCLVLIMNIIYTHICTTSWHPLPTILLQIRLLKTLLNSSLCSGHMSLTEQLRHQHISAMRTWVRHEGTTRTEERVILTN